jgi:RNA polymerase sigma factor (sigma-70 family)
MTDPTPQHAESITHLLGRIHQGDNSAVEKLLVHFEPEVRQWIRRERGKAIEAKYETVDLTQDFFVLFLKYLPNLKCENEETLRKLLYRMIQNMLRDRGVFLQREVRRISRERPLASDTVLDLDPPKAVGASPSEILNQDQENALMRVGLALLDPARRGLIIERYFERRQYADIAEDLGIDVDACRMRCNKAMAELIKMVGRLRRGDIDAALAGA